MEAEIFPEMMKVTFITLFLMTNSGNIISERFEIFERKCMSWFSENVAIEKNKRYSLTSNKHYFIWNDKKVVGYICSSELR